MKHATTTTGQSNLKSHPSSKISGIVADAAALGVHRTTLWKMLRGYPGFANLKTLRRRYDELQASKSR